jgi:hypothetical protein
MNTNSSPSQLKITDMRIVNLKGAPMRSTLIRLDTNQGIYGLGEVRDGASFYYALMLKRIILGENPCNVDRIFRMIKQFGGHARQAGGVCAIEMALMDLAGKPMACLHINWQEESFAIKFAATATQTLLPTPKKWANASKVAWMPVSLF